MCREYWGLTPPHPELEFSSQATLPQPFASQSPPPSTILPWGLNRGVWCPPNQMVAPSHPLEEVDFIPGDEEDRPTAIELLVEHEHITILELPQVHSILSRKWARGPAWAHARSSFCGYLGSSYNA